jgi:hypothetical protein
MHGQQNIKFCSAKQSKLTHQYLRKISNECNVLQVCCRCEKHLCSTFQNCPLCVACIYMDMCLLFQITMHFFRKTLKKDLSSEGQWEFLNMWYIMIIANDILIILGSAIKEQIERQVSASSVHVPSPLCLYTA